ncbi:hypothetical protein LJC58_09885 [Lachnospiraceae bacterium OttesenSCG-928-D06]|nr:hypothetical protein [Lachnospiraceae bacterium OttesenSCG-928-D06]
MEKELLFAKGLEELKELAKEQGNVVTKEQVEETFQFLELLEEQYSLIYDYLKKSKIGIGNPVDLEDYMSSEEKDYLKIYLEELEELEDIDDMRPGEVEGITLSAMAGEDVARIRLTKLYLKKIPEIAKLYTGQGVALEDLIGEGNVALAHSVRMAGCLESASEFEGMAGKLIMEAMESLIEENENSRKRDQKVVDEVNYVMDKAKELSLELRRKVTIDELKNETNMSEKKIRDALRMSGYNLEYIEGQQE